MDSSEKSKTIKYVLISCGVVLVVGCLCLGLVLISGFGVSNLWPIELPVESTQAPISTPVSKLTEDLARTIAEIESQVVQIRGLDSVQDIQHTMISADELEEIVVEDFFSEYSDEDARQDVLVLSSLGLLPRDFDLKGFYESLYSEQIAGFYDEETKEIYVVQGQDFGASERLTYAHEFTHVLQDQVYRLDEGLGMNQEACEVDSEKCAAVQALVEGDASLTEILWFQTHASMEDYRDLLDMLDHLETPVLDSAPPYMSADMYFPYEKGLAFVQHLYDQGEYKSVDQAFANPPVSTEQILHPEKYPLDVPLSVNLPDLSSQLDDTWTLFDQNVMGEWYVYLILNKAHEESFRVSEETAQIAAEGWGGDAYAIYLNENTDETIFIMDSLWDTKEDAGEFIDAFYQYASQRWTSLSATLSDARLWKGPDSTIAFWHQGDRTLWVMAPDNDLLDIILSELQ
jgi:hypothetical protein